MKRRLLLAAAVVVFLTAAHRAVVPAPDRPAPADIFTASLPQQVESTHLALDLTVDFDAQILRGSVTHDIVNHTGATQFVVDTNGLDIDAITADGRPTTWSFGSKGLSGTALIIDISSGTRSVRIDYRTRPSAGGLRWLNAKQTREGAMPAMWSENEPDLARTWIPLQDTPSQRITYDATIRVPPGEMALMSVANNPTSANDSGVYTLSMPHPIPSYLIALTVAHYAYRSLGPRSGVYAEPPLIDDTAYEMQFVPDMLAAAERAIAPYPFERYDLVFPPKYAGGMENPELNFIGQDQITGNHPEPVVPNVVIAHELAHAWFGDLVTLATWRDVWLNESFATYYEKRIGEAFGRGDLAEFALYRDRVALQQYLDTNPAPRLTVLHRGFQGTERPTFTTVYYVKGELFLKTFENAAGRAVFDRFVRAYLERNAFHWVDDRVLYDAVRATTSEDLDLDEWFYGSGLPSNVTGGETSAIAQRVTAQASAFRSGRSAASLDTDGWGSYEQTYFLQLISDITVPRMTELDAKFGFSSMNTPPVFWLIAAAKRLSASDKSMLERVLSRGSPVYTSVWGTLASTTAGSSWAKSLYASVRDFYDSATQVTLDQYLHFTGLAAA